MLRTRMAEPRQLRLVVPPTVDGSEPRRSPGARRAARPGRIVAVGGGKGGVGKSLVAASIGIDLAGRGCRVVLVDCDLGGANLHTSLGLIPPRETLSDFVSHRVERIEDILVPTGMPHLSLVSGALDQLDAANPNYGQKMRFIRQLQSMEADFVILDLAAGTQKTTLDFFLLADQKVLVLAPEPGAVENAHRFVKAAFMRRLRAASSVFGVANLLEEILDGASFRDPSEIFEAIEGADAETGRQLREQMKAFRPGLVVNQARTPEDAELGRGIATAWRRYFGIEMDVLGTVEHDDDVWRAARERRPLLLARSESRAARSLARIASRIQAAEAAEARR
jgi:flagellar biosynthesis protein FlhG